MLVENENDHVKAPPVQVAGSKFHVGRDNLKVKPQHPGRKRKRSCKGVNRSCSRLKVSCRKRQLEGKRVAGCSIPVENKNDHVKASTVNVAASNLHVAGDNLKVRAKKAKTNKIPQKL